MSIMKKPVQLDKKVVELLCSGLTEEFKAFYHYRAMSNWCKDKGFFKAASFFQNESNEELEHAKAIENFIVEWNVIPMLPSIDEPKLEFKGLLEIIELAYQLEYDLYEIYEETSTKLISMSEPQVFDFLAKYRETQRESVAKYADMLNILEGCEVNNKFQLLMLEENLFGE